MTVRRHNMWMRSRILSAILGATVDCARSRLVMRNFVLLIVRRIMMVAICWATSGHGRIYGNVHVRTDVMRVVMFEGLSIILRC